MVDLAVRLDVHVLGQLHTPVHESAVNAPGVGPAPPIDEVEDRVVGIEGLEPCAADTAPDRRLVGDPAEYVHRVAATVVVQAQGVGHQKPASAALALVVLPVTLFHLAALSVLLGMKRDRAMVVPAPVIAAPGRLLQRPDAAGFRQTFDFRTDRGVGLDRREIETRLAADRRDRPFGRAVHLVVHVAVGRRAGLAFLGSGGDAEIRAVGHLAVIDLYGPLRAW